MLDPLRLLARRDKWFLAGGKGALYAPPFPRFLTSPGFWDECFFADIRIPRLFTLLFLRNERPVHFQSRVQDWRPDRLILTHEGEDFAATEHRCVLESQAWVSHIELHRGGPIEVFLWSLPERREPGFGTPWQSLTACVPTPAVIAGSLETRWPEAFSPDRTAVEEEETTGSANMLSGFPIHLAWGSSLPRDSFDIQLAQRHDDIPIYATSLLPEKFKRGRLPNEVKLEVGPDPYGLVHLVQHYRLESGKPASFACTAALSPTEAEESLERAVQDPLAQSEEAWRRFFAAVPQLDSSDPHLTRAYWYRWYGLRLNTVHVPSLPMRKDEGAETFGPYVTEGIGFFRNFITYSAQAHLREVAWMHDPAPAIGILDNLVRCQRADGSFPGHNYSARPPRDFYHADFATGLRNLLLIHGLAPDRSWIAALRRYWDYFWRERQGSLVFDMNETGQEYMSRYQFATERADHWESFSVHGTDAATYFLLLVRLLIEQGEKGLEESEQIATDLMAECHDGSSRFYCDRLEDGSLSPARPATGFYPILLDSSMGNARTILDRWLLDPSEFWLPKGFPATALSDPTFSAAAEWKDKRLNCPWNGRSWPMVNSHLVDVLAHTARVSPAGHELRAKAGEALLKTIDLLFHDGDFARPCCYEHYNPFDGTPALYRGYDDYMHSWIVDLILRHAVGVQPGTDDVDPLPLGRVEWIRCTDIPNPRGRMDVHLKNGQVASCAVRPASSAPR
ncbi:MAG TPA: hypothetical protein VM328_06805 [Fimbriimonadaceae bacterium]|nr:hypothetical protein [Fimbriimonadaceae bacterium]